MRIKYKVSAILGTLYLLFSAACSPTSMKTVWTDKNYHGEKLKKIFVIGASPNPTIRRVFEDEFVGQLKTRGTDAVASYSLIPSEEMLKKDTVESKIKAVHADAVIVTSLIDHKKHKISSSNYSRGWHPYYRSTYDAYPYRGATYEYDIFSLETNLYEVQNEKLIWSGLSDTQMASTPSDLSKEGSLVKTIKQLIKTIVDRLSDSQLI